MFSLSSRDEDRVFRKKRKGLGLEGLEEMEENELEEGEACSYGDENSRIYDPDVDVDLSYIRLYVTCLRKMLHSPYTILSVEPGYLHSIAPPEALPPAEAPAFLTLQSHLITTSSAPDGRKISSLINVTMVVGIALVIGPGRSSVKEPCD